MGRAGCRTTKSRRSQSESAKQSGATGLSAISLAGLPVGLHLQQIRESMVTLADIPITLDLESIRESLHLRHRGDRSYTQTLVRIAEPLISAKAIYRDCFIEAKLDDAICIEGTRLTSKVLRKNADNIERVFPYVITIGDKLEEAVKASEDLLDRYCLDLAGNVALHAARGHLEDHLRSTYALDRISYISPGSLKDWPIENQKPLFSILGDVEGHVGVKLDENCLMRPTKSLSGIYFPTEISFYTCQLCSRERCPGRTARYDEGLAREYGIV